MNLWEVTPAGPGGLAALASDDPAEDAWYDAEIALISLADGSIRTVYCPSRQAASVAASRNGSRIALVEGLSSDRGLVAGTVHVVDTQTGDVSELTAAGENVTFVGWRDDESLWVAGWRSLGSVCGVLTLRNAYEELWSGDAFVGEGFGASFAATADSSLLAGALTATGRPPEVVTLAPGAREWTALTALNDELRGEGETVTAQLGWTAPDGLAIEGLLIRPAGERPAAPLVVIVHGGPTSQWVHEFAPSAGLAHVLAAAGYAVLLPNPRGSAGRGDAFVSANLGDLGGGDLSDIVAGVDACVAAGVADPARVGVVGQSYGGFMAAWAAATTDRFAAAGRLLVHLGLVHLSPDEQRRPLRRAVPGRRLRRPERPLPAALTGVQPEAPHTDADHQRRARPLHSRRPGTRAVSRAHGSRRRERVRRLSA